MQLRDQTSRAFSIPGTGDCSAAQSIMAKSPERTLRRELQEELGLTVRACGISPNSPSISDSLDLADSPAAFLRCQSKHRSQ